MTRHSTMTRVLPTLVLLAGFTACEDPTGPQPDAALADVLASTSDVSGEGGGDAGPAGPALGVPDAIEECNGYADVTLTLEAERPPRPYNMMIVMDESESISTEEYAHLRHAFTTLTESLRLKDETGVRVGQAGIVKYASQVALRVYPTAHLRNIRKYGGTRFYTGHAGTATDLALAQSGIGLGNAPAFVSSEPTRNVVLLITDGGSTATESELRAAADALRDTWGAEIYAVGVDAARVAELEWLTGRSDRLFYTADFEGLNDVMQLAAAAAHPNPPGTGVSYSVFPAPDFSYVSATADRGTVTDDPDGGFTWLLDEVGAEAVTLTYRMQHVGSAGGSLPLHGAATLAWTDREDIARSVAFDDATVEVNGCNTPPVADAGSAQTVELDGAREAAVTLDGTGSTDDGRPAPLSYSWSLLAADDGTATPLGAGPNLEVSLAEGTHSIQLTVDDSELQSVATLAVTVVDPSPPVVTAAITGTEGLGGWHTSDVRVSWSVSDPESEVGAECEDTLVDQDVAGAVFSCEAISSGGTTTESVTVSRDATVPVVEWQDNLETYGVTDMVAITCHASDATSGLASATCEDITGAAARFGPGAHSYAADAVDVAGNSASATATFEVVVTVEGMIELVTGMVTHRGTQQSLLAKLEAAQRSERRGDRAARDGQIQAFISQVRALAGKRLTEADAELLVLLAGSI